MTRAEPGLSVVKMLDVLKTLRWPLTLVLAASLAACTTPPPKPPTPKPIGSHAPAREGQTHPNPHGPGAPGSGQAYGAPSANGAEVDEEEVAADGSTRVISSSRRAAPGAAAATNTPAAQAGAAPLAAASSATGHGGGGSAAAAAVDTDPLAPDMAGVHIDEAQDAAQAGGNEPVATTSGGAQNEHPQQQFTPQHGLRDGRDTRGATLGSPPPSREPPRAIGAIPPRENDILAQQLHEAASREKDPVLRAKLWAKYRRYKAGL